MGKTSLTVYGLEIPLIYYKKPFSPQLKREEIRELIGEPSSDSLNILLAHSPKYGDTYFDWGADLILSGHYHGGIVRIGSTMGCFPHSFIHFRSSAAEISTGRNSICW